MRQRLFLLVLAMAVVSGCNRGTGEFNGHRLGESFAQFVAVEHPKTQTAPGIPYTGEIHCFDEVTLGDECKGFSSMKEKDFDNAHFAFVDDKLVGIESVGAGGIIGDKHQNWNWNLYLSELNKKYGKPDKMTASDAVWLRHSFVVHAYLTVEPMPFSRTGEESQNEHVEVVNRDVYEQAAKK